jgi:flagellar protein FlaG
MEDGPFYKTGRYTMSMQIMARAAVGGATTAILPQQDAAARQARMEARADSQRAAMLRKLESSLPGNNEGEPSPEKIRAATNELEQVSLAFNRRLQFFVDQKSEQLLVKVIDRETDKVIKVLPPEELQRLHNRIKETIGLLFDEKV